MWFMQFSYFNFATMHIVISNNVVPACWVIMHDVDGCPAIFCFFTGTLYTTK
jgi:hypothetical protein